MTDYNELMRQALASTGFSDVSIAPDVLIDLLAERDKLRAEVAGLRTGYEAYEQVNAELKAESDSQRKDLQNLRTDNAQLIYALKQQEQSYLALKAKNEALRKDAERYRWLRIVGGGSWTVMETGEKATLARFDQCIDAALGQGEQS
ncbi:hypothetical protein [Pseudomonas sp. VB3]|uniref:hypothetical protein n=1 Tax=Pseudomonas sp. VB3 TaxID=2994641 RepID=UPI0022EC7E70|nr:hypothetical protein [Pseudomonas sp. VB3]